MLTKLTTLLIAAAITTTTLPAGMWSVMTAPSKTVQATAAYTIETPGYNPRVYEWTTAQGDTCIALMTSSDKSSAPAMSCFKKK